MIRFIHASDIHLGHCFSSASFNGEIGELRRLELWKALDNLIEYVLENSIDYLLITGDIIDDTNKIITSNVRRLRDTFMRAKDLKIILLTGNHDYSLKNSFYDNINFSENVYIIKGEMLTDLIFDEHKLQIIGIGYNNDLSLELDKINKIERPFDYKRIVMLHGEIGTSGSFSMELLKSIDSDYIALGHIHKPLRINENIAYSGSLEPLDFGEIGDRGFYVGELGDRLKLKFVNAALRRFEIIEVESTISSSDYELIDKLMLEAKGNEKTDLFRIVLKGTEPEHFDIEIFKQQLDDRFFYTEIKNRMNKPINLERLYNENKDNIIARFIDSFSDKELTLEVNKNALELGLKALMEEL